MSLIFDRHTKITADGELTVGKRHFNINKGELDIYCRNMYGKNCHRIWSLKWWKNHTDKEFRSEHARKITQTVYDKYGDDYYSKQMKMRHERGDFDKFKPIYAEIARTNMHTPEAMAKQVKSRHDNGLKRGYFKKDGLLYVTSPVTVNGHDYQYMETIKPDHPDADRLILMMAVMPYSLLTKRQKRSRDNIYRRKRVAKMWFYKRPFVVFNLIGANDDNC